VAVFGCQRASLKPIALARGCVYVKSTKVDSLKAISVSANLRMALGTSGCIVAGWSKLCVYAEVGAQVEIRDGQAG
jgi:hypothetical protein